MKKPSNRSMIQLSGESYWMLPTKLRYILGFLS